MFHPFNLLTLSLDCATICQNESDGHHPCIPDAFMSVVTLHKTKRQIPTRAVSFL